MTISVTHLKDHVVVPMLEQMGASTPAAIRLMMGTAAAESGLKSLVQNGGPALGLWQMEPLVHDDIYENVLKHRDTSLKLAVLNGGPQRADRMVYDLRYACAMARCHYLRHSSPLPNADDMYGLAVYWQKWYNSNGSLEHFANLYSYHLKGVDW